MSEVGDTITPGADIDSPASPLGPGWPGIPTSPENNNVVKSRNYTGFSNDNDFEFSSFLTVSALESI